MKITVIPEILGMTVIHFAKIYRKNTIRYCIFGKMWYYNLALRDIEC